MLRFWPAVAVVALTPLTNAQENGPPNVVILVADDLGWGDVSYHGSVIRTPNLDRLAREGAELDRFYACPACSPTRAGLLTGRYPVRYGMARDVVRPWAETGLDPAEVTVADVLAGAGYEHRGVFGKWHLGHSSVAFHPLRRGFTEFVGHYNGAIDYFTHKRQGERDWHRGYEPIREAGYSTDLIADAAVEFIERCAAEPAPFLCYVAFNAPHEPLQAKEVDLEACAAMDADGLPRRLYGASPQGERSDWGRRGGGKTRRQTLAAMISSMDQGVGRIVAALDRSGVAEDTLVWFLSDNGGAEAAGADNGPLRGEKGTLFEGGMRVPAAVRWPGRIPAGRKVTATLAYIDVLPTLMQILGIEDHGGGPIDGMRALDVLTGQVEQLERDVFCLWSSQSRESIALVEPTWKMVVSGVRIQDVWQPTDPKMLFRISEDPGELQDLVEREPEVATRMLEKIVRFAANHPAVSLENRERPQGFRPPADWKIPGS